MLTFLMEWAKIYSRGQQDHDRRVPSAKMIGMVSLMWELVSVTVYKFWSQNFRIKKYS